MAAGIEAERRGLTGQMPAASSSWTGQGPAVSNGQQPAVSTRSGKQPAVRTGKQTALALESSSGKHRAVGSGAGAVALPSTRATAVAPLVRPPSPNNQPSDASPNLRSDAKARDGAWIRLGETALNGFDKVMLTLAGVESLWGAMILVLGAVAFATHGNAPVAQLIGAWVIVVLLGSILATQALPSRPMYRRAKMSGVRRWLQGAFIFLYSVVVQAAGIWGALAFHNASPTGSSVLAVVAYVLFGVSAFIAGIFGISTVLG